MKNVPQPGDWFPRYRDAWMTDHPGEEFDSGWVREVSGYWVWYTQSPQWDKGWFHANGFLFPPKWIWARSFRTYYVGTDNLSDLVRLPG